MSFQQRQIVEVSFRLPPNNEFLNHPVVILSNNDINEHEGSFVAIMMTHTNANDCYSFPVTDEMVSIPFDTKEHREIRLHLIGNFLDKDVISNTQKRRFLKVDYFERLITQINTITFEQ